MADPQSDIIKPDEENTWKEKQKLLSQSLYNYPLQKSQTNNKQNQNLTG
jgi:hypothetical protein